MKSTITPLLDHDPAVGHSDEFEAEIGENCR
jgi:hypothetical protein